MPASLSVRSYTAHNGEIPPLPGFRVESSALNPDSVFVVHGAGSGILGPGDLFP